MKNYACLKHHLFSRRSVSHRTSPLIRAALSLLTVLGFVFLGSTRFSGRAAETATASEDPQESVNKARFLSNPLNSVLGEGTVYLNEIAPIKASEGAFAGRKAAKPPSLKGVAGLRGLRVVAPSEIRYTLGGQYVAFVSEIGIDDEAGTSGSVIFQVFADGVKLFDSGVVSGRSAIQHVFVNLLGKSELKLVLADAGDGNRNDLGDWANAKLVRNLAAGVADRPLENEPRASVIVPTHSHSPGEMRGDHAQHDAEMALKAKNNPAFVTPKNLAYAASPQQLSEMGMWGPLVTWPFAFASAANLPDGRILAWGGNLPRSFPGGGNTYAAYWDPETNQITSVNNNLHDMFCGIPTMMADGRVFLNGGHGTRDRTSIYDYKTNQWIRAEDMNRGRWYPGSVMMPNGQVYTALGEPGDVYPEIWTQGQGWDLLTGANLQAPILSFAGYQNNWLPYLHLAPNGLIFHSGPTTQMNWLDPTGNGAVANAGLTNTWYPKYAAAVMYDVGKILIAGGQAEAPENAQTPTNQAMIIDVNGTTATKTMTNPMGWIRKFHNAIVLPNGEVMVIGGNQVGIEFSDDMSVLTPEIWNPGTGMWRPVADISVPRNYHSLAMLLTDGRVWSGGGGLCDCASDHLDHQIYTPPYLYNSDGTLAARPTITSAPQVVANGQIMTVQATAGISKFSLIKMTGLTHNMNSDLRFLDLSFNDAGSEYQVTLPTNVNVLTPGYWMLFALNSAGVPSVSKVMRLVTSTLPVLTPVGDQNTDVNTPVNLQVIAFGTNSRTLTYQATGLPAGLTINSATGLISGTPTVQTATNVTINVTDSAGESVSEAIIWTVHNSATDPGVFYEYFEGNWDALPNYDALTPIKTGILTNFSLAPKQVYDFFAFRFTGKISIAAAGTYTFFTESDDGSKLYINGSQIVNNDGLHGMEERSGSLFLSQGLHDIVVTFFEKDGGDDLIVRYAGPGIDKKVVPSGVLFNTSTIILTNPGTQTNSIDVPLTLAIEASGGIGGLSYSATTLPTGLTINANTGVISGTPTVAGSYNVTVTVEDGRGVTNNQSFIWTIHPAALIVNPIISTPKTANTSIDYTASVTNGVNPRFKWLFGDNSPETAYSTSPTISHSYTQPGIYVVKLTATDDRNVEKNVFFTQAVHLPPTANSPTVSMNIIYEARATGNHRVWTVNQDNDSVSVFDAVTNGKLAEIAVGSAPRSLALAPDGRVWVANKRSATMSIISPTTLAVVQTLTLPYGSQPYGVAFSPAGSNAFVTLEAAGKLLRLDASNGTQTGSLDLGLHIRHLSITGDGTKVYVSRFITPPLTGENTASPQTGSGGGQVLVINAQAMTLSQTITLRHSDRSDTENSGRGIPNYLGPAAISPDGVNAWTPSKQDNILRGSLRDSRNLTFESTVRSITSHINLSTGQEDYAGRIDHNNAGIASTALYDRTGSYLFVAAEGSREVIVVDPYGKREIFHIPVGRAPQGLAISQDGLRLYVHNFMDRSINVLDISKIINEGQNLAPALATYNAVASEQLTAQVLHGKQLFYDAQDTRLARDAYISCASCHNDGDGDGRVWDFTGMGEGLRNTIALNGRAGAQGFKHWSGNFDEIQDFEGQIRNLSGGTGLMTDVQFNAGTRSQPLGDPKTGVSADLDALGAYVSSLSTFDKSPYRTSGGALTTDATAGKAIFQGMNCAQCHGGSAFTVSGAANLFDIGTIKPSSGGRLGGALTGIDSPTLRDVWATAPYLHDGSAPTLGTAVRAHNGVTISDPDLAKLVAYLQQIGSEETTAPAGNQPPNVTTPANQTTPLNAPVSLQIQASDPENAVLSYSASGLPSGLSINPSSGLISGTTTIAGVSNVTITVSDGFQSANAALNWTVSSQPVVNVALGKSATQSSQFADASKNPVAAKAVDGNTNGVYANASVAVTGNQATPWWQVDLERIYNINHLVLWNRTDCCGDRLANFYVFISATDMTGRTLSSLINDAAIWKYQYSGQAGASLSIPASTSGRYVRVQLTSSTYLQLAEVQVFGEAPSGGSNHPPIVTTPAGRGSLVNVADSLQIQASDQDNNLLSYSATGLPPGLSINAATGLISGTPSTLGTYTVEVTANDGSATGSASFVWKVQTNVALGKAATQSSPFVDPSKNAVAGKAVDGNTSGVYANASLAITSNEATPWWQVNLGADHDISKIILWNRTDCCGDRLANFYVFVSATDMTGRTLSSIVADSSIWKYQVLGQAGASLSIPAAAAGRYVRVQLTGTNFLQLAEVQVVGEIPTAGSNHPPVVSTPANRDGLVNAVDSLQIQASDQDGDPVSFSAAGLPPGLSINPTTGLITGSPTTVGAYNVTITANDGAATDDASFVWKILTNVALGKVATQSSPFVDPSKNSVAAKAIDGNTNGVYANASLAITNNEATPWWQVNLGTAHDISRIVLWNRTDCCGDRLANFYVFVSPTDMTGRSLSNLIGDPAVWKYQVPGQAGASVSIPAAVAGQFVRVQLTGSTFLQLAEVQVLGVPSGTAFHQFVNPLESLLGHSYLWMTLSPTLLMNPFDPGIPSRRANQSIDLKTSTQSPRAITKVMKRNRNSDFSS
jgi:YVTN family beta-propeller protein